MTTVQERKRKERRARRRHIQVAAREVFSERGFAKTSIEQVARRASLSVGAIYLYFRSKEDLYVSLLEDTLEGFDRELAALGGDAGREQLQAAWTLLVGWAVSDGESARILRLLSRPGVRGQLSDEVAERIAAGLKAITGHLAALVAAGVEAGHYRAIVPDETAAVLWAGFLGVLEADEARRNLDLSGPSFTDAAQAAFVALEAGFRASVAQVAEAA